MKLYIKNMVCPRCITSVEQILKRNNFQVKYVRLGEVALLKKPTARTQKIFTQELQETGFELLDDQKTQLINMIYLYHEESDSSFGSYLRSFLSVKDYR